MPLTSNESWFVECELFFLVYCMLKSANMYTMTPNWKNRDMQTYWCSLVFFLRLILWWLLWVCSIIITRSLHRPSRKGEINCKLMLLYRCQRVWCSDDITVTCSLLIYRTFSAGLVLCIFEKYIKLNNVFVDLFITYSFC